MASRTNTTTPHNKTETSKLPKERKARKGNGKPEVADFSATDDTEEGAPLQAKLGDVAEAKASKKAKGKSPPPRENLVENFERMLPCKLTDVELLEKSRERSHLSRQINAKNTEIEAHKKRMKNEIERMCQEVAKLVDEDKSLCITIELGTIDRLTRCQRVKDWNLKSIREFRLDTMPTQQLGEPQAMTPMESDEGIASWVGTEFEKATKKSDVPINNEDDADDDEVDQEVDY